MLAESSQTKNPVSDWFPDTPYYQLHRDRLAYSFHSLPTLGHGFRCLCIGSWGAEAPCLYEMLGASEVFAIRAPDDGVPPFEVKTVRSPVSGKDHNVQLFAFDIEREPFPSDLSGFDLVIAWEVLEHLCADPSLMVWQAIQATAIDGVISITTPNALWHVYTIAQMYGENALGLQLQHHLPFATHWRLYSPAEVADLFSNMGCRVFEKVTFLDDTPFSWKSRLAHELLKFLRRGSGNGEHSLGKVLHVLASKVREAPLYRPTWLHPRSDGAGRLAHLDPSRQITSAGASD